MQAVEEVAETVIPYIVQSMIYIMVKNFIKNGGARKGNERLEFLGLMIKEKFR